MVAELSEAGNSSVFGLIDWDGKNRSEGRVTVLAAGRRNGLENVLLDPLVIGALLARLPANKTHWPEVGLAQSDTYTSFLQFPPARLQVIVDGVEAILSNEASPLKIECRYLGGFTLNIAKTFLEMDDHKVAQRILEAFPQLQEISKGQDTKLVLAAATTVLSEKPDYIPEDLVDAFRALLDAPAHPTR